MGGGSCGDVLLVPLGMSGHINPMMYVVNGLLKRGVTATMVIDQDDKNVMKCHLEGEEGQRISLVPVETEKRRGGPGGPRGSLLEKHYAFGRACEPFLTKVLEELQAGGKGPKCMITDQFQACWSQSWAEKLQIPNYVSIVSPATFGYLMYNHTMLMHRDKLLERIDEDPIMELPGIPEVRLGDLSGAASKSPEFITENGNAFGRSAGLLFNTFYDLEASAIDAFEEQLESIYGDKRPKLLSIGPMLPPEFFSDDSYQGSATDSECIEWLNNRPPASVVYIAFGSGAYLSEPQIQELAKGLEDSEVSFLWILRLRPDHSGKAKDVSDVLPSGFQERTKDRGLVYSLFAPQLQILSNPATGGFLTHCGWNSSLESICRGVPMIGWPLSAEQKLCCRVAEHAGVTIPIRPQLTDQHDLVKSDEVEKAMRYLMKESEGKKLRARTLAKQKLAKAAVASGGSSSRSQNLLLNEIQSRSN